MEELGEISAFFRKIPLKVFDVKIIYYVVF
jgi:hypothetical protein